MRRILLVTFLLVFLSQSSGVGMALEPTPAGYQNSFAADLRSALTGLIQSPLLAMGLAPDRYAAMHAPAPARVTAPRVDATKTRLSEVLRPVLRGPGLRGSPPEMLKVPPLPKDAEKLHPSAASSMLRSSASNSRATFNLNASTIDLSHPTPVASRHTIQRPGRNLLDVTTGSANTTGINPWWTFEEGALPGTGKYMVNVGTGNLLVQSADIDIPERGIDLAFQRTYNSMSLNDTNASSGNDDGSPNENVYGNGWTNTFDAHVAITTAGGISVFDIDGARYDYTPNGTGCLTPPPGMHNLLCTDGGTGWLWYKKTGTVYYFYGPTLSGASAGYAGRLNQLWGRNNNNRIIFYYSWVNGDSSTSNNLTQIVVGHSDGQQLVLAFGMVNGRPLLSSITRPDGSQVTYSYDTAHELISVGKPGDGSANGLPLPENYGYYAAFKLAWTSSPRWNVSGGSDGSFTNFYYDGSSRVNGVLLYGFANIVPNDGTSTALQPSYGTGANTIAYSTFSYPSSVETSLTDVDGHATNWFYDSTDRVTQTQDWTGSGSNLWLLTYASWDSNNNLTEAVDARGYATDYAYDSNGNTIAIALPSVSTNQGTFRPTSLYSYDRTNGANNIVAYCDPIRTHALPGGDWTGNPGTSDSLCPTGAGATSYTWQYPGAQEIFGRLIAGSTPLGYHVAYSYNTAYQGGDFSLATDVTGDCITQVDGNAPCPHQTFHYDSYGNLISYNKGNGAWTLTYDSLNRLSTTADPDSSNYVSYKYYYPDGEVQKSETPYQHGSNTGTTFSYDADGNETQEIAYHGGTYNSGGPPTLPSTASTTTKFYDGADRLVDVQAPHDAANDAYTGSWITRYIYDISGNGQNGPTPSVGGQTVNAYGNLYKTQELLPTADVASVPNVANQVVNGQFKDTTGNSFDALDRPRAKYSFVLVSGSSDSLEQETITYDAANPLGSNNYGLMSSDCNALSQCSYPSYDTRGLTAAVQYSASTGENKNLTFDPDGRAVTVNDATFGSQTYTFDADGRLTQSVEPSGGGVTSPATLNYHYYGNGMRSALDVSSSALSQTNLFAYSYRADGKLEQQQINLPSNSAVGNSALNFTYSAAGRLQQRSESGPAANGTPTGFAYDASYGFLSGIAFPAGSEGTYEYDPSGALLGQTGHTYSYSARGELTHDSAQALPGSTVIANGVGVTLQKTSAYTQSVAESVDGRMGVEIGNSQVDNRNGTSAQGTTFDAAGRETDDNTGWTSVDQQSAYNTDMTRSYDQMNHVLSSTHTSDGLSYSTASASYAWGPNGHPALVGATPAAGGSVQNETLHWDGNQLLFTTNAGSQLDDVKIGSIGDITPLDPGYTGLTFWDRDPSNYVVFCHNATGAAGSGTTRPPIYGRLTHQPLRVSPCAVYAGQSMSAAPRSIIWWNDPDGTYRAGSNGVLGMPHGDGFTDGFNTIQGARSFDAQIGSWTTPDAYSGEVNDPMSQKSYVWNRNNPVTYSDPDGYFAGMGNAGAAGYLQALGGTGASTTYDEQPESGTATPDPVPTVSQIQKETIFEALKDLGVEAAAIAVDHAARDRNGPFSGDAVAFLMNLQALVQSGLDWLGIKTTAQLNLRIMTVSVSYRGATMSLTGNGNGLVFSVGYHGIHQGGIITSGRDGAMIAPRQGGSYGDPAQVSVNMHIHFSIKGVYIGDPWITPQ